MKPPPSIISLSNVAHPYKSPRKSNAKCIKTLFDYFRIKNMITFKIDNILIFAFLFFITGLQAQDIKPLDYQGTFKKLKITSCTITEVKMKNKVSDTIVVGKYTLNAAGQMTTYTEFNPIGRLVATHFFQYDAKGKITQCDIELADEPGVRHNCQLTHDAKGRLTSRTLPSAPNQYWYKEVYTYNAAGVLIKSVQHHKNNDQEITLNSTYPEVASPKENHNLNFIFDQRGLLLMRQFYNAQNKVQKSHHYQYK
jgi:uncharacterized lipoprotein NlpE involved in copper resistance